MPGTVSSPGLFQLRVAQDGVVVGKGQGGEPLANSQLRQLPGGDGAVGGGAVGVQVYVPHKILLQSRFTWRYISSGSSPTKNSPFS